MKIENTSRLFGGLARARNFHERVNSTRMPNVSRGGYPLTYVDFSHAAYIEPVFFLRKTAKVAVN